MDHTKPEFLTRPSSSTALFMGHVLEVLGDRHLVHTASGNLWCERAASCLLLPAVEDTVLISANLPDESYVLAVLKRPATACRQTLLGEGVMLEVSGAGSLKIDARSTLHLDTTDLKLSARNASLLISRLSMVIRDMVVSSTSTRWIGNLLETTLERLHSCLGSSRREVKGLDLVRAGSSETIAEQVLSVKGQQILITGDRLARLDADQVHIG